MAEEVRPAWAQRLCEDVDRRLRQSGQSFSDKTIQLDADLKELRHVIKDEVKELRADLSKYNRELGESKSTIDGTSTLVKSLLGFMFTVMVAGSFWSGCTSLSLHTKVAEIDTTVKTLTSSVNKIPDGLTSVLDEQKKAVSQHTDALAAISDNLKASEQRLTASELRLATSEAKISKAATDVAKAGAIIDENKKNLGSLLLTVQAIEETQAKTDKVLRDLGSLKELKNQLVTVTATSEKVVEATSKATREAQQATMKANEANQNTLKNSEAIAAMARPSDELERQSVIVFFQIVKGDLDRQEFESDGRAHFAVQVAVPGQQLKLTGIDSQIADLQWFPSSDGKDRERVALQQTALSGVIVTAVSSQSLTEPGSPAAQMFPEFVKSLKIDNGVVVILGLPVAGVEPLKKLLEYGWLGGQVRVTLSGR